MDETVPSQSPTRTPTRPPRPDLDSWRGDIREQPPAWRRRPRSRRVRDLWDTARPILAQLGESRTWD
jgi:hypothetical protein